MHMTVSIYVVSLFFDFLLPTLTLRSEIKKKNQHTQENDDRVGCSTDVAIIAWFLPHLQI